MSASQNNPYTLYGGTEIMLPRDFRWPGGKHIAVQFRIALEAWSDGVAPGAGPMGYPLPNGQLDLNQISWGDYGPRRGIYRMLERLGNYGIKASITCCGILCERYPDAVRAIAAEGHDVTGHSYAFDIMAPMLSEQAERDNIRRCTDLLEKFTGKRPKGWLNPRVTPGPNTVRLLIEEGYEWCGDTLNDDLPYVIQMDGKSLVMIPLGIEANDLMTTIKNGLPPRAFLELYHDAVAALRHEPDAQKMDVATHAHVSGRPYIGWFWEQILADASRAHDLWLGTRSEAANHVLNVLGLR